MAESIGEFVGAILCRFMFGAICKKLADDKGYSGSSWFWWGFFFNVLALLVIILKKRLTPPPVRVNNISALEEYKRLLDSGVITPEEFERKKAELLNSNAPVYTYYTPPQYNNGGVGNGKKWVCPECGNVNPPGIWVCESCGREK
ncbi:MAG: SHOCT domain-containing protein [Oscillospiraceae bacterium]|nr:SHOCT domain-containing protein [Oscillospiraceae bacterium]